MKRPLALTIHITFFVILSFTAYSKTIIIPGDASTIQDGIATADDLDTVLVLAGTYSENINLAGREVVVLSDEGPETTILQPSDSNLPVFRIDNAPTLKDKNGRGFQPEIAGFTIEGGNESHTIYIDGPTNAIIRDNIFRDNIPIGNYDKAVIVCYGDSSAPLIKHNVFYGNYGITCVWIIEGRARIINNTFAANKSAFYCNSGVGEAMNNIAVNNIGTAIDGEFGKLDYNDVWNNTSDYG